MNEHGEKQIQASLLRHSLIEIQLSKTQCDFIWNHAIFPILMRLITPGGIQLTTEVHESLSLALDLMEAHGGKAD